MAGRSKASEVKLLPSFSSWSTIVALFTVIPTMSTAYVCHYNVHPIYVELSPPRWDKMKVVATSTLLLCTSIYCLTAFFGYLLFGSDTLGDVLANFDVDLGLPYTKVRPLYCFHSNRQNLVHCLSFLRQFYPTRLLVSEQCVGLMSHMCMCLLVLYSKKPGLDWSYCKYKYLGE